MSNKLLLTLSLFLALYVASNHAAQPLALKTRLQLKGQFIQGGLIRGRAPSGSQLSLDGEAVFITSSGSFAFGFARDAARISTLEYISPAGAKQQQSFQISQRDYRIQRINGLPPDKITPRTQQQRDRIKKDIAQVKQARMIHSDYSGFMQAFIWPAKGRISGVYGSQRILNGEPRRPHFGVDIAGPMGSPVIAPADGKVVVAEADMYFSGGTLILDHGGGVFSSFLHLSKIKVKRHQKVKQGQQIAEMGATGRATGSHLDWRINWFQIRLDAAKLVSLKPPEKLHIISGEKHD